MPLTLSISNVVPLCALAPDYTQKLLEAEVIHTCTSSSTKLLSPLRAIYRDMRSAFFYFNLPARKASPHPDIARA